MQGKKVLLINLPFEKIYEKTKIVRMAPSTPPLGLATLGGSLLEAGHKVRIFDFNLSENNLKKFEFVIKDFNPDFVGISFVTPLFGEMKKIVNLTKQLNNDIVLIGGGPHCSSFPKKTLEESELDVVVVGEGDFIIKDIANGKSYSEIRGIAYKKKGKIRMNKRAEPIENLDKLPFPAYHLYDFKKYKVPRTIARKFPVAWIETSRGCMYNCVYCNKNVFGRCFRTKSVKRVIEEMKRLKKMGFKEVHLTDDAFTTDMERAKKVCDLLIREKVNLDWALITGARVNQVDYELLRKMKKAGCYMVSFGIESGNQQILNNIKKGITLKQVEQAVGWAKKAGLEVWGYLMIGLPGETEETMRDTIEFAKKLPLDLAKMSIMIPLPATPIFEEWEKKGYLKTKEWDKFSFYTPPVEIYDHPNLSWEKITEYYNRFYYEFYFRPRFILKRLISSFKNATVIDDIKIFFGTQWFKK